jgi:hypothetical protein
MGSSRQRARLSHPDAARWQVVFYYSKYYEFVDTWIVVLSHRRPSFLQTFHHFGIVVCMHWSIVAENPLMAVATACNACVHAVMYVYYALASIGMKPPGAKHIYAHAARAVPWLRAMHQRRIRLDERCVRRRTRCSRDLRVPRWRSSRCSLVSTRRGTKCMLPKRKFEVADQGEGLPDAVPQGGLRRGRVPHELPLQRVQRRVQDVPVVREPPAVSNRQCPATWTRQV